MACSRHGLANPVWSEAISLVGIRWTILMGVLAGCQDPNVALDEAEQRLVAADEALAAGNPQLAIEELTASIEARPNEWAYHRRAQLFHEAGDDVKALADAAAGLELDPDNSELKWLHGELSKPPARRFKGRSAQPPSRNK